MSYNEIDENEINQEEMFDEEISQDEISEEELNEEEVFGENEITDIDDDLILEDELIGDEDTDDEDYEYVTAKDIPVYEGKSFISLFLFLPVGIMAMIASRKTQEALRRNNLQLAIDYSDKAALYFKISVLFAVLAVILIPVSLTMMDNSEAEAVAKQEAVKEVEAPRVIPRWEISAKKIINLEKTFFVDNGFYRYYFSQEMPNDDVLAFRYDTAKETFHYMTKIEGDKISVIAYEANVDIASAKAFIMDMDYKTTKYEFPQEK